MKMDRILLKLSGEALAGEKHTGFDEAVVRDVAKQVKAICDKHIQVSIVIGGGNFWRGRTSDNMDRVKADQIGMPLFYRYYHWSVLSSSCHRQLPRRHQFLYQ